MFAFDLLFLDGEDLRRLPLIERRGKLRDLLPRDQRWAIQFSDQWEGSGAALFTKACAMGLEGIVSKRALSPYRSGPSKFWLKTKNVVESELILLGTDYDNERRHKVNATRFITAAEGSGETTEEPCLIFNERTGSRQKVKSTTTYLSGA